MSGLTVTEAQYQEQVIDLARSLGWRFLHIRRSQGRRNGQQAWQTTTNIKGWPDLFLWHERHGFVALELKSQKGRPSPEQIEVLAELEEAGARTMIAKPSDIDAVASLRMGRAA